MTHSDARRLTAVLFVTQSLGSAALLANATVNPIVGVQLSRQEALAGLPGTLLLIGAGLASYPAGRLMQRAGRRPGLTLGFVIGAVGMIIGGLGIVGQSFVLFLLGLLLIGAARGAVDQSRYAAADAQPPSERARAISTVVFAGTIGAVGGPALVAPLGAAMHALGLPDLAGPMFGGALLFGFSGLLMHFLLRPDSRDIAQRAATVPVAGTAPVHIQRSVIAILMQPVAGAAVLTMIFGQAVMVLVMTVTSLHMHHHDHGLGEVSIVISSHTLGMFGLSFLTGAIADRWGRQITIVLGALLLIVGCLMAPASLMTPWIALALFLVGLGWNMCYIAGSTLLADALDSSERASVQGATEVTINLTSALSSLSSGFIMAAPDFGALCLISAVLSLIPMGLAIWRQRAEPAAVQTS